METPDYTIGRTVFGDAAEIAAAYSRFRRQAIDETRLSGTRPGGLPAKRRGLSNFSTAVDALPAYVAEKNLRLFSAHNIYTSEEVSARYKIHVENYSATIEIEARTMIDMIRKDILPAVSRFGTMLSEGYEKRKSLGLPSKYMGENARGNSLLTDCLHDACMKLEKDLRQVPADPEAAMRFCHDVLVPDMNECRSFADELETITDRSAWPFPTYSDLLFSEG